MNDLQHKAVAENARPASASERLICFIASRIRDREQVIAGTNLAIPRAALLLAHWHHAPNLRLQLGGYMANLSDGGSLDRFAARADFDALGVAGLEAHVPLDFENLWRVDLTFVGGLQVDRFGNTNLIGLKNADGSMKMRGPGTVGTATLTSSVRRYFIYLNSHSKRVLVPKCDYISTFGWGQGGHQARADLGLPGGGPELIITPEAVMDFDPQLKCARLRWLMPGRDPAEIAALTGFELPFAPDLAELPEPPTAMLEILRHKVMPASSES